MIHLHAHAMHERLIHPGIYSTLCSLHMGHSCSRLLALCRTSSCLEHWSSDDHYSPTCQVLGQTGLFPVCCYCRMSPAITSIQNTRPVNHNNHTILNILIQASDSSDCNRYDCNAYRTSLRTWSAAPQVASLGQQVEPPCQQQLQQALSGCCGLQRTQQLRQQGLL